VNEPAWHGVLAFNEFTNQIIKLRPPPWHKDDKHHGELTGPWDEEDGARVAAWIAREWEATPHANMCEQAIAVVAKRNVVHPPRDWLNTIKWDRKPRVDTLLIRHCAAEDTPYTRAVTSMFMIGAVARLMEPGCKVDHTLILEGKTSVGKSTFLEHLIGKEWFLATEEDIGSKDFFQSMRGKWIIELPELDALTRGELSRVKAVLTKTVDTYRAAYGKVSKDYPRHCVFTGTTEEEAYLKDSKGNRRFWPIRVFKIIFGSVLKEREQVWAEAVARYKAGEKWHVTDKSLLGLFEGEQEQRRQLDPWESIIAEWLHGTRFVARGVTTADVLSALKIAPKDRTRAEESRVGGILRKLGWEGHRERYYGTLTYLYRPVDPVAWGVTKLPPKAAKDVKKEGAAPKALPALAGPTGAKRPASVSSLVERLRNKPFPKRGPKG
jgi:putative DNA primase/helicase